MMLKRITANTLAEAVEKTRVECGEDALLVETKKTRNGYLIVAAKPPAPTPKSRDDREPAIGWTRGFAPLAERAMNFGLSRPVLRAIEKTLIGTRVTLDEPGDPALPSAASRVLKALITTAKLELPKHKVMAFVGPTGVGKTTTLAKIAARAVRDHDESVAILTIDTYRVAAVEQLRAFSDMIGSSFGVAFTPADLRRLVDEHAGADRILIDTSGRSPFDKKALQGLRATLTRSDATSALCLSACARRVDLMAAMTGFAPLEVENTIITKWDETVAPGETLSVLVEQGLPISHVTVGQEVPEDIVEANAGALAATAFDVEHEAAKNLL